MIRRIAAALLAPAILASAALAADVDRPALYKHLKKTFNTPPGVEFQLGELKPSPIDGFQTGTLTSSFRGNEQKHQLLLSDDGRYYILSDVYPLKESPLKGLLEPQTAGGEDVPAVHVTKDAKYFFIGEARDLKIDPDAANMAKLNLKGAMSRGGGDSAPVVLVEFSDLECPYCRNAHLALEEKLEATYGKKVRWVFKHFPLTGIHPWAYSAAIAVTCAAKQKPDAGWKVEAAIFQDQQEINPGNLKEKVLSQATKAGLKAKDFESCYDKQQTASVVDADMKEGNALKVNSTPTLIVNGRMVQGFRDFESLKAIVDEMLKEKGKS